MPQVPVLDLKEQAEYPPCPPMSQLSLPPPLTNPSYTDESIKRAEKSIREIEAKLYTSDEMKVRKFEKSVALYTGPARDIATP